MNTPEMGNNFAEIESKTENFKTVFSQALERMRGTSYTLSEAELQKEQLEKLGQ